LITLSGKYPSTSLPENVTHSDSLRPELREYLLHCPNIDLSNKTAAAFAAHLRFLWPFDLSDAWMWNTETGLYSFSKLFEERLNDISSWAMSTEFFELYPHMTGYIPAHNAVEDKIYG
jgi:hypothetical protein